ncbi:unnamed protein product, partial [Tetraodon nigroviridis]
VSLRHCLQHPAGEEWSLQVTKVSWSCTGAVLACAYGRIDDGDWSTEAAHVCTWNLLSPKLQPGRAEAVIDVPAAVSALSCHPTHAALLAEQRALVLSAAFTLDPQQIPRSLKAPPGPPPHGASVTPTAPALFSFSRSSGPIYSIHPSPFHWGLFVSGGTDGLAHLHSLQQSAPLLSLKVCDSYVFQVQWSPSRPLVFAAATAE